METSSTLILAFLEEASEIAESTYVSCVEAGGPYDFVGNLLYDFSNGISLYANVSSFVNILCC